MNFYQILTEVIDLRSFSNLWYWIGLAVLWSSLSRVLLGAPYDMVRRARKQGGQMQQDVEAIVAIIVRRWLSLARAAAVPLLFIISVVLTMLFLLAFWFWIEFAQAVFFLLAPMVPVGWLTLHTALKVETGESRGEALFRRLLIHRRAVQMIGMVTIFVTALFGMWQNFSISVLH